jgi:chromosome segregation protein
MDKGAHFVKCDFQVHTPRDANWDGAEAVTPAERKAYAEELVQVCRTKGLGAIAITDHHDFTFVSPTSKPRLRQRWMQPAIQLGFAANGA